MHRILNPKLSTTASQALGQAPATLVDLLRTRAEVERDELAYRFIRGEEDGEVRLSFAELDRAARAIAVMLIEMGLAGQRVLLPFPPGLEYITGFFGCLYAGAIAVPVPLPRPRRPSPRLLAILRNSGAQAALTTDSQLARLEQWSSELPEATGLVWLTTDSATAQLADQWQQPHVTPGSLAFLQYTSGSTDDCKGVMVSHGNLVHNLGVIRHGFQVNREGMGVSWLPMYHDMGLIGGILEPLFVGGPATLLSAASFLQRPARWLEVITRYRGTISGAPNFAYELCVEKVTEEDKSGLDLSSWETAYCGAEPIRADTLERFARAFEPCGFRRDALYPCFGLAESTLIVSGGLGASVPVVLSIDKQALKQNKVVLSSEKTELQQTLVGCGGALLDQRVLIVDPDTCTRLPEDGVGEIWVSGPSVAQGYWNCEELTNQTFGACEEETSEGPFLRTGDLGFVHAGQLFVTGRLKDLIIIRGGNHYPHDVERTVRECRSKARLSCVAAFSVQVEGEERLVVVEEVQRGARRLDAAAAADHICRAVVEHHGVRPYAVVFVKPFSIPMTSSGKIRRIACREAFLDDSLRAVGKWIDDVNRPPAHKTQPDPANRPQPVAEKGGVGDTRSAPSSVPSSDAIESWLATRLSQQMKIDLSQIDVSAPFDHFGLDSLAAVQLSGELEIWLGRNVSPTLVYEYPTVKSLARHLAGKTTGLELQPSVGASAEGGREPIAVVGMGCRFPGGADDPQSYWELLSRGVDAVGEIPRSRWDADAYYDPDPDAPGKMSTRWGGFLDDVDRFDPQFFGISPREAVSMDPQQRLLLEVAWEALENAGAAPDRLSGSQTGVFVGICNNDYSHLVDGPTRERRIEPYSGTGSAFSVASGRISYVLGLNGPNLPVDTACSSSLVAVHLACQSLLGGECRMALAGGVNLLLAPEAMIYFSKVRAMAADGRCKTFDASADGYVRGEGCGLVVLKRLADAVSDGDRVLAVIRGSAVNHDGRSNGLTAPSGRAQEAVIRQALSSAGIRPDQVGYVEAHGTGTPLGDPIEVNALGAALGSGRSAGRPLMIGSAKTNLGHLEAAAGIAGLIKVVLALENEAVPPHLHLGRVNPHISLDKLPISIPTELTPWTAGAERRLAGVSSFGFSGTNAHLVVEEPPAASSAVSDVDRPLHTLALSAKTPEALHDLADRFARHTAEHSGPGRQQSPADICFTANTGRSQFDHRLAAVGRTADELSQALSTYVAGRSTSGILQQSDGRTGSRAGTSKVAFLFTGQGSLYPAAARELFQTQPTFRRALQQCEELLEPHLELPLTEVLYGADSARSPIDQAAYAQPVLFALEYALAAMWQSWGIVPAAVVGHSVGQYVAACVAGLFSLEDALGLIAGRGKLVQSLPAGGKMVAVAAGEEYVAEAIAPFGDRLSIAAVNSPASVVISGDGRAIEEILNRLSADRVAVRPLDVSHAFHSADLDPILDDLEQLAGAVQYRALRIPLVCDLTGGYADQHLVGTPDHWRQHARHTVRFSTVIDTLYADGHRLFLEIGPRPVLSALGAQCVSDKRVRWLASLSKGGGDWRSISRTLGALYVEGADVDWAGFDSDYRRRRVPLPTYPFQRKQYWWQAEDLVPSDPVNRSATAQKTQSDGREIAESAVDVPAVICEDDLSNLLYRVEWRPQKSEHPSLEVASGNGNGRVDNREPLLGRWLILADHKGTGARLAGLIGAGGGHCTLAYSGDKWANTADREFTVARTSIDDFQKLLRAATADGSSALRGVIHLWSLDEDASGGGRFNRDLELGCGSALLLVQSLAEMSLSRPPRMWLITRGSQAVGNDESIAGLSQSPLWGLANVIALEHPEWKSVCLDLDEEDNSLAAQVVKKEIELNAGEPQVALRDGIRYAARLARVGVSRAGTSRPIRSDGTYLITGGLGEIGLLVARWLVDRGARNIALLGRSPAAASALEALAAMEQSGAAVRVMQADVSRCDDVEAALAEIRSSMRPLKGIIHAAGVSHDEPLVGHDWARFSDVLSPKILGARNLDELTRDVPLDFFVMFSSVVSVLGAPGAGSYSAANAFMDALAHRRRSRGLPATSINWGPWDQTGMAGDTRRQLAWRAWGVKAVSPERLLRVFGDLLDRDLQQVAAIDIDWNKFAAQTPGAGIPSLVGELVDDESIPSGDAQCPANGSARQAPLADLLSAPQSLRPGLLAVYLQQEFAAVLGVRQEEIPIDGNIFDLGLDSLMTMALVKRIEAEAQFTLYPREIYDRPTVAGLADYLAVELARSRDGRATRPEHGHRSVPPRDEGAAAQRIAKMSIVESGSRVAQRSGDRTEGVVFLLSPPRSGSTLLRVMLAGHSDLFVPPEMHLLSFERMAAWRKELAASHLDQGLQRALMELEGLDGEQSRRRIEELVRNDTPVDEVYRMLKRLAGGRQLVDKSPTYAANIETLNRAEHWFRRPKYVHLLRHPGAVTESFVRMRMDKLIGIETDDPYALAEEVWTSSNRNIREFLGSVDSRRHHVVRFEELVSDPEPVMRDLAEFLDIPYQDVLIKPYEGGRMTDGISKQSAPIDDPNFHQRNRIDKSLADAWRRTKPARSFNSASVRLAGELGYEIATAGPSPRRQVKRVRPSDTKMRERFIDTRGMPLCTCSWGPDDGPLALCLHGILDQGAIWEPVAVHLAAQGYHVVAPDLRGHGRSGHVGVGGSYHLIDLVADVDAVLHHFAVRPITLVGHSLGAAVAAKLALGRADSIRRLVLVEPPLSVDGSPEQENRMAALLDQMSVSWTHLPLESVEAAVERLRQVTPSLSDEFALRLARRATKVTETGVFWNWDARLRSRAGLSDDRRLTAIDFANLLRTFEMPVTLVFGSRSNLGRGHDRRLLERAADACFTLEGGHSLTVDAPEALADVIARDMPAPGLPDVAERRQ